MGPVVATLVLEGGRVGDELGGMALLELGSALAAVTSSDAESHACASTPATDGADEAASRLEPGRLGRAPHWIDDTPPRACSGGTASSSRHIATVVPGVRFPSLEALRAAVRRCALTRAALVPVAAGSPEEVAAALGASRAATCAAQVLAPGRKGVSRPALEAVGARLWDAGVGRAIAANRAWLESLVGSRPAAADATSERDGRDNETTNCEGTPNLPPVLPHYYVYPEGIMGEVAAWGMDSRARFRAIDAPNAMPPEQATLAVNAARVKPGDFVVDPCVGGGAVAFAAAALGATTVLGCDVDERALDAAREAARRFFRTETNGETNTNVSEDSPRFRRVAFAKASLLEDPRVSEAYGGLENAVDAIVTDLPYGVRSAAAGVGDGPGQDATPASMLDALLVLARRSLRPSGRVAVWLRRAVRGEGGEDEAFVEGAMSEARVAATCASFGFEVERRAAETRASGVQRALYVLTRNDFRAERAVPSRDASRDNMRRAAAARRDREATDAAAHEARAAALVMHCMLRRNENHGRVAASGGQDIWRAAWTGDVAATRRLLSFSCSPKADGEEEGKSEESRSKNAFQTSARASRVLHAREPAGARNTPLTCAAMYGRNKVVALLLDLGADADGDHGDDGKKVPPDARRRSATHRAAERGAAETVAALLRNGGNPFVTRPVSANGGTAFHAAAERGHVEVFRLLLDFCRERDGNRGAEDRRKTRKASSLAAALAGEDDSGRTPALAAARRGHADVVTAALEALEETSVAVDDRGMTPTGIRRLRARMMVRHVTLPARTRKRRARRETSRFAAAAEAARWGHVAAVRAAASFVDLSGASRRGRDALARLAFEAERWQRDDVRAFVASVASVPKAAASETKKRAPGNGPPRRTKPSPPSPPARRRFAPCARSGAALFYARDFFRDPALVSSMLAAFEAAYLPRDHPLVTPADRKGERRAVPRDQAYYAARYVARGDAEASEAEAQSSKKENRKCRMVRELPVQPGPDATGDPLERPASGASGARREGGARHRPDMQPRGDQPVQKRGRRHRRARGQGPGPRSAARSWSAPVSAPSGS
jgi:ankyrin repeat protein